MLSWHLAAFNVAKMRHQLDDPRMADFVDNLELVNTLGDRSPGFVWRHQTEDGDSTAERIFDDQDILLNFTIWDDVDSLHQFTYRSDHTPFLRRRREWFVPLDDWPVLVLWWVPAGTRPTLDEAKQRLARLRDEGPSPDAFTFRDRFPPPADVAAPAGPQATRSGYVAGMDLTTALDWARGRRNAVLITLRADGRAQSSDIAYTLDGDAFVISVTDDRAKTRNMRRDPRVVLHLTDPPSWSYLAFDGTAELSAVTTEPGDATSDALVEYFEAVSGGPHPDWDEYRQAMVDEGRLIVRLTPRSVVGQIN